MMANKSSIPNSSTSQPSTFVFTDLIIMAEAENSEYTLQWSGKPLGFSIVMDTTGNNAYVSSIQKSENVSKGLKLAAQITAVNGKACKDLPHGQILRLIKEAATPINLTFQPRSFANNPESSKKENIPPFLALKGATVNQKRINGNFELIDPVKEKLNGGKAGKVNGRPVWKRVTKADEEDVSADPIYCWFWPALDATNKNQTGGKDMWMISRGSQIGKGGAYACVVLKENQTLPLDVDQNWQTWDQSAQKFVPSTIAIEDSKA